jgi:DNA-binding transcriptional LysR family regulator
MSRIADLEAFLAIVDQGSLTAAARRLNRSLQSISRSLAALEHEVGAELVQRTTHQSRPTESGTAFYRRVKPALAEIDGAKREAGRAGNEPSGILRVGASVLFAPTYLLAPIARFMSRYPRIEVELKLSDRFVDLIEDGLDVAIRIGELPDSGLKAKRLGALRRVVFGAPQYFKAHGRPTHPAQLREHQCIVRTTDRDPTGWEFRIAGKPRIVRVSGRLRTDNTLAVHAAVACGVGIGNAPLWQIRDLVQSGSVEVILERFEPRAVPIHAVWPATKLPLAKTRLFVDELAGMLQLK